MTITLYISVPVLNTYHVPTESTAYYTHFLFPQL